MFSTHNIHIYYHHADKAAVLKLRDDIMLDVDKLSEMYRDVNITIYPKREYAPWKALYIRGMHYLYKFEPEDIPEDITGNTVVISPSCNCAALIILDNLLTKN